jgi:hypothetical protein
MDSGLVESNYLFFNRLLIFLHCVLLHFGTRFTTILLMHFCLRSTGIVLKDSLKRINTVVAKGWGGGGVAHTLVRHHSCQNYCYAAK